ncbi:MAG: gamma carbonic anhydrase family protein [Bacteroidales bacterium]|nr:gamma carbonic anhydrase family protein [Bacteroidales bacterium]
MAIIRPLRGFTPKIGKDCFIAENAVIIGDVEIGDGCSVWYNAVLRGDVNSIRIGNNVNIQDGAVLHTLYQKSVVEIGDNVTVAHNAVVHGAKLHSNTLVGISSVLLDWVEVKEFSIVAAGAIVTSRTVVEPYSIYAGNPAKKIKDISEQQAEELIKGIASNYKTYADWYTE